MEVDRQSPPMHARFSSALQPRPEEDKKEKSKVVSFMRKLIKSGADVNAKVRHVFFRV
jgi:hypothetical protein